MEQPIIPQLQTNSTMLMRFFAVHGYYFFLSVGAVAMLILMLWRRNRFALSFRQAGLYTVLLLITGIAGAKLLFFFECGMESFSGMSFFGAVFLVLLVMPCVSLAFKLKPLASLDACAPCVAAIVGFQRFGCYCAGCCGGIPMGSHDIVWPTQLMEGFGDMGILALLLWLEQRGKLRGYAYPVFLIAYGILRFTIEFVRDTPKDWCGISHGQCFSLAGILLAVMLMIGDMKWKKSRNKKQVNI